MDAAVESVFISVFALFAMKASNFKAPSYSHWEAGALAYTVIIVVANIKVSALLAVASP